MSGLHWSYCKLSISFIHLKPILADLRWLCRHSAVYQSCANLSLPLSGALSPSSHLFFSHFRDNKRSRADSQRPHCCVGMCSHNVQYGAAGWAAARRRPFPSPNHDWCTCPITFVRPVKTTITFTFSYTLECHTLFYSTHIFLQLNYLIHDTPNSRRAWAL